MKHKILIAYDGTEYALKAVEYAAGIMKAAPEKYDVVLFFVLPPLPIDFVEYGDLPGTSADERAKLAQRKELIEELKKETESRSGRIFAKAVDLLKTYGVTVSQSKFSHCTTDVAGEIINELDSDVYKTVVIGRKGKTSLKERLIGGTAEKIVRYVKNRAVWVVE